MGGMGWTFTRPRATQGALTGALVLAALGVGAAGPVRAAWAQVVAAVPEWVLILVVPTVLHHALYWGVSAFFHRVDTTDRPAWIARHRIQDGRPKRPPLRRVLVNLAWNQLFWAPIMMLLIWGGLRLRGWAPSPDMPTALEVGWQLVVLSLFAEVYFYASHRLLHWKPLMRRFHKVHHEFRTSAAMASEYAHPVEFTLGNFGTLGLGVVVLGPSLPVIYLFTVVAILTILSHHCGYALPGLPAPAAHDWHHHKVVENFGTAGILDRLLRTDGEYRTLRDGERR